MRFFFICGLVVAALVAVILITWPQDAKAPIYQVNEGRAAETHARLLTQLERVEVELTAVELKLIETMSLLTDFERAIVSQLTRIEVE